MTHHGDDLLSGATWRKSTRSQGNGGDCVEVAGLDPAIAVRDSKNPAGPVLSFTSTDWTAFMGGVKYGDFDIS